MSLVPGARLGSYEILAPLGAGGMGEVFRARDTRLDRTVAIKVLPPALASEPQLRERFDREARAISSLRHPHICTLFDIGHQDGIDFLVLEYLEGETVAERLMRGTAFDPKQALKIAVEICDALHTAHRSGIVHRDLKPANVMLTKAGAILLDFGLAKNAAPAVATAGLSLLPTTPPNLTAQGTILGTFQYMAPEQIEGLDADARSDIFAFGALLFEMLTGRPAFAGKTRASVLGAILKDDPPAVSQLQPLSPASLDRVVSTCLAKDPDDRYQTARDLLRDLKWVASESNEAAAATGAPRGHSSRTAWVVAALSTLGLIAAAGIAVRRGGEVTPVGDPVRFTIAQPENTTFGGPSGGGTGTATQLAVSPNGDHVAFVAASESTHRIWLRPLASLVATPIPGSEAAAFPFWSPDGRFIGFFAAGKLKKVPIGGGPPIVLCDAPSARGGSWSQDNVILFTPTVSESGVMRVSAAGGAPTSVTTLDPTTRENSHRWPHFLPDGRHFVYTTTTGTCCPAVKPGLVRLASLDPAEPPVTLFQAESSVTYGSGNLLYAREDTLMAQPFDLDTRQPTGEPFPLAEHVSTEGSRYVGASVSVNGTLVYAHGNRAAGLQLTWFDRAGRILATTGDPGAYSNLSLSPDERRVATTLGTGNPDNRDVWVIDIARNVRSRLTFDAGMDRSPVWSPDGTRVAFEGARSGKLTMRQVSSGGTVPDEPLLDDSGSVLTPTSWSADGRYIAYTRRGLDVWILPLFGDRKPFPVAQTEFTESSGTFSPDGRWIAYTSNEGGLVDVYVQALSESRGKYQISRNGGTHPVWRADGTELFYLSETATMMAVPIRATDRFEAGVPVPLFPSLAARLNASSVYAVTKDGKRFLVTTRRQQASAAPLTVVLNWTAATER